MERRLEPVRSERVQRVKASIAGRLRRVCADFSDAEFDLLVQRMAELQVKYIMRDDGRRRDL